MSEEINSTNAFMEVTSRKVEGLDRKISGIEEKIKLLPDNKEVIGGLTKTLEGLRDDVKSNRFPAEKIRELLDSLDFTCTLLKQQLKNKVLHEHHVPKLIWLTAGLFIVFALVCSGWYVTYNNLDSCIANDTKYRSMKLDTTQKSLQLYLDRIDSLFDSQPDMRKIILAAEEQRRINFERLEKAQRLKAEAKELERKIRKK